jgi:hypothetical protein
MSQIEFKLLNIQTDPILTVEVDLGSGSSSVYFDTDQGTKAGAELVKDIEVGPGYTELLENEEVYKTGCRWRRILQRCTMNKLQVVLQTLKSF